LLIQAKSQGGNGGPTRLFPESPTQFDGDEIALRDDTGFLRIQDQPLPSSVPYDEQIISRFDGPSETGIRADVL
jgi:hypothetical protein